MTPTEKNLRHQVGNLIPLKYLGGLGFGRQDLEAAQMFIHARLVYGLKLESAGNVIKISGKIATRSMAALEAKATLLPYGKTCELQTSCSCIEGSLCKHVAGLLQAAGNPWYEPREDLEEPAESAPVAAAEPAPEPEVKISPVLQSWLDKIPALDETSDDDEDDEESNFFPAADTQFRLLYVLNRVSPQSQLVQITLTTAKLNADGDYVFHAPFNSDFKQPPEFLSPGDLALVDLMKRFRTEVGFLPQGKWWANLLPRLWQSGRALWEKLEHPALQFDEEKISVNPGWQSLENGRQRPTLTSAGRNLAVLPTTPLHVIDLSSHTVHPVRSTQSQRFLLGWLQMEDLSPGDADHLARFLEKPAASAPKLPAPAKLRVVQAADQTPQPILRLFGEKVFSSYYAGAAAFTYDQIVRLADVEFTYEAAPEKRFPFGRGAEKASVLHNEQLIELQRNLPAERDLADTLSGRGLRRINDVLTFGLKPSLKNAYCHAPDAPTRWFQFLQTELPKLKERGWLVETDRTFDLELLTPDAWYEEIKEGERPDWFTVDCGFEINGERIPLLPAIIAFLRSEGSFAVLGDLAKMGTTPIMLPVGKKYLPYPADRFHRLLSALTELYSRSPGLLKDGKLEVHRLRAAQLAALATKREEEMFAQTSDALQQLGSKLSSAQVWEDAPKPVGLKADLRPYQLEGYRWLRFLATARLGGVLADDMGLGKTLQTLAHLLAEKEAGAMDLPSLIVAPKSVVFNWAEEAMKFTPKLRCMIYTGQDRAKHVENFRKHDLVLTSYPILARDEDILARQPFHMVILDEAQNIKNNTTRTAQAAYRLDSRLRLALSGTPMENHLGELWSIFNFLMPGFLGTKEGFNTGFREPIEEQGDNEIRQRLSQRIAPVLLRRTKQAVLHDLPDKIETIHRVELSAQQKDLYEAVRVAMDKRVQEEISVKGAERSQIMILDALLKLRQVCCDPRLLKLDAAKNVTESAKLDALMEVLVPLIEDGRRVLLFSQFTQMLALIQDRLNEEKIGHLLLTGQTEDRQTLVHEFQKGNTPVFLISLKAGGVGLNLTAADTVIHYDPWWNPAAENQATDRAHRFGQKNTVFVYKFICQDTIEEKILLLQRKKAELVQGLLEGKGEKLKLTSEDLAYLLQPVK